jgi:transposase-like protein
VRAKVQEFVQALLDEEVTAALGRAKSVRRAKLDAVRGARNGYGNSRRLALMAGTIRVRRPRVRDLEERFVSRVLPLFQRRTWAVGETLAELYLHGLAHRDFEYALRAVLGEGAPLSATSIGRLRDRWQADYTAWNDRPLAGERIVYLWADGLYVKAGLEKGKAALLVLIGGRADGRKVVLAIASGQRESTESWRHLLRAVAARGLAAPQVTIADGHLGLWAALAEVFPTSEEQRCWNHRIVNILDQLPKRAQVGAHQQLTRIAYAETRAAAERERRAFVRRYGRSAPTAVARLEADWERLVTFYRFPHAHWRHLRTTNIIESPFAMVRLRTTAAKRFRHVPNATALIWKLLLVAEQSFQRLNAAELLPAVADGARFIDGVRLVTGSKEVAA